MRPVTRRILLSIALLVSLALAGPPVVAQAPLDAAALGPPAWVTPGTRITSYAAGAAVSNSSYQLIEDPDGNWTDPVTGKRYRKTDETGESVGGASGDGLSEVDVVSVDGGDVVLSQTLYGIDHINGRLFVVPLNGWRQAGGAVDGVWANPAYLATLRSGDLGGLMVLRGPYALNASTYDAISIVNPTPGAYSSQTYDTASGLLLASTTRTSGGSSPVRVPGQDPPQAADQLGIGRFVGMRQLTLPGIGSPVPGWVAGGRTLDYDGTSVFVNPLDPSSMSITSPMQVRATFTEVGATWAIVRSDGVTTIGGYPNSSSVTGVTSGTGLYWWSPEALAGMSEGQALDTDPQTGLAVSVGSRGTGPGGPTLDIEYRMPGTARRMTYDLATGVLVRYQSQTIADGTTVDLGIVSLP